MLDRMQRRMAEGCIEDGRHVPDDEVRKPDRVRRGSERSADPRAEQNDDCNRYEVGEHEVLDHVGGERIHASRLIPVAVRNE